MTSFREIIPELIREPNVPAELRKSFQCEVALSNSRRLKAVTWLLLSSLIVYLVADYISIVRSGTPQALDLWTGILIMRPFAMVACLIFIWQFGPLRTINDIKPKHLWVWKAYTYFFLIYTAVIVGFMFPLKESIAPVYIFLLGPCAFIAMTTRQTTILLSLGMVSIAGSLYLFVPEAKQIRFHLINAMIISWVSFAVAHVTYRSTFRDFMNRQIIEKRNRQLETARLTAEEASRAKSHFLASVSHEIRTPMNSILGMTEVALHTPLTSEQRDYIETARESALHLMDIINDILDFSRIEARKMRLLSTDFDLPAVVHSAMKTVSLQAEGKGVELDMEIMSNTPRFLKGDPGRLRQILINLLGNAITHTDEGYIRITVGPWSPVTPDKDRPLGLLFSVKDSGTGIPREQFKGIFDAFTQVDNSTTRTYGGSGLGLAICKNIVSLMGGEISVESSVGKGSEFIFSARFAVGDPKQATEQELIEASWNSTTPVKPSRVLLVDDNPLNIKVQQLHLERMGMETTVAESGAEALMLLAENDFDIVLMDLEMPGMDGHETVRRIREGKPGQGPVVRQPSIPVLAITAHALADVRDRCEREGMNGFVTKPVGFGELGSAMRQILGGDWRESSGSTRPKQEGVAVLDLVHASTLLGVSQAEIRHLLPNALDEIEHKLGLAERGVQTNTLREVALQSHTLKSVSASIGAEATRQAALKLENAARREDTKRCQERLTVLRTEVDRLMNAVEAL